MGKKKGRHGKRASELVKVPRSDAEWLSRAAARSLATAPSGTPSWPRGEDGSAIDPSSLPVTRCADGELARPALLAWDGVRWTLVDESLAYGADLGDGTEPVDLTGLALVRLDGSWRRDG